MALPYNEEAHSDGFDYIFDSSGKTNYDRLIVGNVTNISQLGFARASAINEDPDGLLIYLLSDLNDNVLNEGIIIENYFSGSSYGIGKIEYLNVNGVDYWLGDIA